MRRELVRQMRALADAAQAPVTKDWSFEHTEIFDRVASLVIGEAAVSDHDKACWTSCASSRRSTPR